MITIHLHNINMYRLDSTLYTAKILTSEGDLTKSDAPKIKLNKNGGVNYEATGGPCQGQNIKGCTQGANTL